MKNRAVRRSRRRKGFTLIEVLVAMTLLSIILMSLARATFSMAAVSRRNGAVAKRTAAIIQESNKFNAIPFSTLLAYNATTKTLKYGDLSFQRRITVTADVSNSSRYTVKIVLTPYIAGVLTTTLKDSVILYRTNPPGSPLCTSC